MNTLAAQSGFVLLRRKVLDLLFPHLRQATVECELFKKNFEFKFWHML